MSDMKLTFKTPDEIVEFVNTVSRYDFDVDVKRGRIVVDGRCIQTTVKIFRQNLPNMRHSFRKCGGQPVSE